jgi:type II secretory pathway component PulC
LKQLLLSLLLLLTALNGCTFGGSKGILDSSKLSNYGVDGVPTKRLSVKINREQYKKSLVSTATSANIRLIELLYRKGEGSPFPEYRVFGVNKGSAYDLMGLEDADILIGANGYVINDANKFRKFIDLLGESKNATLNIRRNEVPMLITINLID